MKLVVFILIFLSLILSNETIPQRMTTEATFDMNRSLSAGKNITDILKNILTGYEKLIRPAYSGPPVLVGITININNINFVSEVNMDYSMDIFFRQFWVDKRLAFEGSSELVVSADILKELWVPDTFIANDKNVYFHVATVQNKFIRIYPNGQIVYSMRMTITASCPMNFRNFPMDHQVCNLEIESYGFRMDDIKYMWGDGSSTKPAVDISKNIELTQFRYKEHKLIERQFHLSTGIYSRLTLKIFFERNLGHYIIQIYLPSTLIVILSTVSFWLDRTSSPARVSLGITTVLTMLTLIWSTNASLPKISYVKSIDVYLVFCFFMTFASVIEFGIVSFLHRYHERIKKQREKGNGVQKSLITKESRNQADIDEIIIEHPNVIGLKLKASTIDRYARIVFPSVLGLFHLVYWTYYLTISNLEDENS